jgi:hypothetical protein
VSAENVDAQDWTVELERDGQYAPSSKATDHVKVTDEPSRV